MEDIKQLLRGEIESGFGDLKEIEMGSKEYTETVDGITKLVDRVIEMDKIDIDLDQKIKNQEIENNLKIREIENEKKDRFTKNCIAIAGIVVPVAVTVWGTFKVLNFETEGTVTSIMGRGFINKLLPKGKN